MKIQRLRQALGITREGRLWNDIDVANEIDVAMAAAGGCVEFVSLHISRTRKVIPIGRPPGKAGLQT